LPVIAEDLGLMTPDVPALRRALGFPGMKVLQFAFDDDATNGHLPHNHDALTVVYTGTHDNDTTRGWWLGLDAATQQRVRRYFGSPAGDHEMLLRAAQASVADTTILPMQDILDLAEGARMNTPGLSAGCWEWRFDWSQTRPAVTERLAEWCRLYGRTRHQP
jgi:4-alpha-glucanotransferase